MRPLIPWFQPPVFHIPLPFPIFGLETLDIHGFGLLVATGFIVGGQVATQRALKVGFDPEVINRLIGWIVVGVFVGGHVGYGLMYQPDEYLKHPENFLKFTQGLSSFGGFVVCVPLTIWFFRREKVNIWPYVDSVAIGLTFGWAFGRLGCFVAHDHPGTVTDFYLGVYGMCPGLSKDVACHDMGLYEALWSFGMGALFLALDRVPRKPGIYPILLGTIYAPTRFMMDFLRPESTDVRYSGLTPAQYWCVVFFAACLYLLMRRLQSEDEPYWKTAAEPAAA